MDKNRVFTFLSLCVVIIALVLCGIRENKILTRRFFDPEETAAQELREKEDLEMTKHNPDQETVTIEFEYQNSR